MPGKKIRTQPPTTRREFSTKSNSTKVGLPPPVPRRYDFSFAMTEVWKLKRIILSSAKQAPESQGNDFFRFFWRNTEFDQRGVSEQPQPHIRWHLIPSYLQEWILAMWVKGD